MPNCSVREIVAQVAIPPAPDEMPMNKSVPNLRKVTPVLAKLLAIGLATDQTRIFNMAFSEPASTIYMPGDSRPFHQSTHEEPVDETVGYQPITSKFSTYSMEGFAALVAALDGVKEGDGTLLDHSLVLAYTDTSNAKLHAVDGIPMILAGSASGRMKTGIHYAGASTTVARVGPDGAAGHGPVGGPLGHRFQHDQQADLRDHGLTRGPCGLAGEGTGHG